MSGELTDRLGKIMVDIAKIKQMNKEMTAQYTPISLKALVRKPKPAEIDGQLSLF